MKTQATHDGRDLANVWVEAEGIDVSANGFVFLDGRAVTCSRCGGMVHRDDIERYGFTLDVVRDEEHFDTLCGNCLGSEYE